eukprot:TRINITY_DN64287_c0_g1_i1.p1 TRINITY_DN64287_c0_g1~~TRINITY_DN64287_c0_g1_i1.p1  ORF type:complete len:473 (-),score=71.83 TRINITY_DN64287_c0_g1_i1:294-1691(-)
MTPASGALCRFTLGACWFQFFISGVFYGLSPLALPVGKAFKQAHNADLEKGLMFYGFAVLMAVQSITSGFAIFVLHHWSAKRQRVFVTCAHLAWPAGFACLALSVQLNSVALFLGGAFPLLGISIGVQVGYVHLVLTAEMWGRRVNKGHALTGGFSALGALTWNFVFGETINALGFDQVVTALWIFCAIHGSGIIAGVVFLSPMTYYRSRRASEQAGSDSDLVKAMTMTELSRDWRVYVFTFVVESLFLAGLTMKTLMSELFEKILQMDYIRSVRYSGACLVAYAVARFVSPLFAAGDHVFRLFMLVLAFEGTAYAFTPAAVNLEDGADTVLYTVFRVLGGLGFAILKSNSGVLSVRVFGPENVARISGIFLATEVFVGLGPSLAFSWHLAEMRAGELSRNSYNGMFYFCAVLVLLSAVGTFALQRAAMRTASGAAKLEQSTEKELSGIEPAPCQEKEDDLTWSL